MGLRRTLPLVFLALTGCAGNLTLTLPPGLIAGSPAVSASAKPPSPGASPTAPATSSAPVAQGSPSAIATIDYSYSSYPHLIANSISVHIVVQVDGTTQLTEDGQTSEHQLDRALATKFLTDIHGKYKGPVGCSDFPSMTTISFDDTKLVDGGCEPVLPPGVSDDLKAIYAALGPFGTHKPSPKPISTASPTSLADQNVIITFQQGQSYTRYVRPFKIIVSADHKASWRYTDYENPGSGLLTDIPAELTERLLKDAQTPRPPAPDVQCQAISSEFTTVDYGDNHFSSQLCTGFWPDPLAADVTELEKLLKLSTTPVESTATPTPAPIYAQD